MEQGWLTKAPARGTAWVVQEWGKSVLVPEVVVYAQVAAKWCRIREVCHVHK